MIDVAGLASTSLTASDFVFSVGTDGTTWTAAPAPISITVRSGAGVNGSDRVEIIWADGAILNKWLKVTMLSNANTGLVAADTFYVGNLVGDADGSGSVETADEAASRPQDRFHRRRRYETYDFNKDGKVNATDDILARTNVGHTLTMIGVSGAPSEELALMAAPNLLEMTASTSLTASITSEESASVQGSVVEGAALAAPIETPTIPTAIRLKTAFSASAATLRASALDRLASNGGLTANRQRPPCSPTVLTSPRWFIRPSRLLPANYALSRASRIRAFVPV